MASQVDAISPLYHADSSRRYGMILWCKSPRLLSESEKAFTMRRIFVIFGLAGLAALTTFSVLSLTILGSHSVKAAASSDWTMYGHDVLRSNYNAAESTLNVGNVPNLVKKWTQFAANGVSVQPIESNGVV